MDNKSFRSIALVWIAAGSLLGAGCGDDSTPPETADSTGGTPSGQTTGSTVSATGQNPTADTTAGVSTSMGDGNFLDPSSDDGPPEPGPNGTPCDNNGACESEFCFVVPMLGGTCSECLMDSDCGEGTCSLDFNAGYALCTDGSQGVMCDSDEGCMGDLVCSEILNTGGLFPLDFCSECRNDDVPCADGQLCSPVYDLDNFAGFMGCVDPMSVPNNEGCPLVGPVGDGAVCMSGLCGVATLFDLIPVGVCGECLSDMDCPGGTCQAPSADSGLMGAVCI